MDKIDRQLIVELDRNSRQSATQIGHKLRVHRNVINFRIKRLVEQGIIREFVTMISPAALGLTPYKIYLQFCNLTHEKEQEMEAFIKTLPVYWSTRVAGRWDYIIGVLCENNVGFNTIKEKILATFGADITARSITTVVQAPHYYRTYLNPKTISSIKFWLTDISPQNLDSSDLQILRLLAGNARLPVTEIAQRTKLTAKTVLGRIRRLERKGIIYDFRISLNLEKIGFKFYKAIITLKDADPKKKARLMEYFRVHPNVIHVVECLGAWDLEPEFELESAEKFYSCLTEIRHEFADIIQTVEPLNILQEFSYICLPKEK